MERQRAVCVGHISARPCFQQHPHALGMPVQRCQVDGCVGILALPRQRQVGEAGNDGRVVWCGRWVQAHPGQLAETSSTMALSPRVDGDVQPPCSSSTSHAQTTPRFAVLTAHPRVDGDVEPAQRVLQLIHITRLCRLKDG